MKNKPGELPVIAGKHLTLDGYECDREKLDDLELIYEFLDHCPDLIHMTKTMLPYAFKYHAQVPEDRGVSGFVLGRPVINISIHTFPERGYLSLDIFSAKNFNHEQAVDYVTEVFGISRHEVNLLDRGKEFPREARTVDSLLLLRKELGQLRKIPPGKTAPPNEAA